MLEIPTLVPATSISGATRPDSQACTGKRVKKRSMQSTAASAVKPPANPSYTNARSCQQAKLALLWIGTNDTFLPSPPDVYADNLRQIIGVLQEECGHVGVGRRSQGCGGCSAGTPDIAPRDIPASSIACGTPIAAVPRAPRASMRRALTLSFQGALPGAWPDIATAQSDLAIAACAPAGDRRISPTMIPSSRGSVLPARTTAGNQVGLTVSSSRR